MPRLPVQHVARLLPVILCAAVLGCDREPGVVSYLAPRDESPPTPAVAPGDASLRGGLAPAGAPSTRLTWELPDGWRDTGEVNEFRVATLSAGEAGSSVEVAVSAVPGQAGSMTDNVNRWRRQLGLPPATRDEIMTLVTSAGNATLGGFLADLTQAGEPPQRMLVAWFEFADVSWYFKALGTPGAIDTQRPGFDALIASVTKADPGAPPDGADTPVATVIPDGWTPQAQPASPRLMAFDIADGEFRGELAVTRFPGQTGDVLANINRWRQQIQLPPLDDPALQDAVGYPPDAEPDGQVPIYRLTDDATGDDAPFVLVMRVPDLESTWFIKLNGQRGMRQRQTENFLRFIDGLQLPLSLPAGLSAPHDPHAGHDHD